MAVVIVNSPPDCRIEPPLSVSVQPLLGPVKLSNTVAGSGEQNSSGKLAAIGITRARAHDVKERFEGCCIRKIGLDRGYLCLFPL